MTDERFNPPNASWWSVGWNVVGVFAVGLGVFMVVASEFGESADAARASWFLGGLVTIAVGAGLFLGVFNGWHLLAQREVTVHPEHMEIRRWLDLVRRRPGVVMPLQSLRGARLVVRAGGAKLDLESDAPLSFSIWFWALGEARRLADHLEARGIPVSWELPYPRR